MGKNNNDLWVHHIPSSKTNNHTPTFVMDPVFSGVIDVYMKKRKEKLGTEKSKAFWITITGKPMGKRFNLLLNLKNNNIFYFYS